LDYEALPKNGCQLFGGMADSFVEEDEVGKGWSSGVEWITYRDKNI